ncbi:thrombospondin type 3 repeat-containing protein [uncultured Nevskia sp.]|uniref:thrombospondin type 3 repeat-containing protein n=1 Tax=uncultured Nevskia sp. TaxID=228950 RepID=UPI0025D5643F|nr:thrombospondin type 3 repeat-containing protein [uncultured Nevskia sp.]
MTSFARSMNLILAALLAAAVATAAAAPSPGDGDGDGVPDDRDECPYSAATDKVNAAGCSISNDADSDGVPDDVDLCPYSTIGIQVDAQGCALDEDFDGVANGLDQCPGTAYGEKVDSRGCEIIVAGSQKNAVAKKDEPVPATKLAPPTGPAKVIVKTNPDYVDENELFAAPPPRPATGAAEPVVVPVLPVAPAKPAPAPAAPVAAAAVPPPAVPTAAIPTPAVPKAAAPVAAAPAPKPVEAVIIQVKPSRELGSDAPSPVTPAAPTAAIAAKPAAPVATSIPAPAVAAPVRHEAAVVEPKVVLSPEEARANAEQRATMSPASADRTSSLPKAATVTLPVPSLSADQFPPGYAPNRAAPPVSVPAAAVPGPAAGTARKLPVTGIPASAGTVQTPATPTAVAPVAPVTPAVVPAVPVPRQSVPAASVPGARVAAPVIAVAPAADESPRAALPQPAQPDWDRGAETLAQIGFAAGSVQLNPAATQRVRELSGAISSRLSTSPGLVLRLEGHRHAGEAADIETGRGLALRKAFLAEGIDDSRIRIVVIDGAGAVGTGDYLVAVQLVAQ